MVSSVYGDFGDGLLLPTLLMIFIGFTVYIYIYVFGDLRVLWGYTEDFGILLDGYVSDLRTLLINIYWYAICVYTTFCIFFIPPGFNMQPYRAPKIGSGK